MMGSTIRNALVLQFISSAVGLAFCALAVTLVQHTFWLFCLLFGVGLMGLFVATAPLCEASVPPPKYSTTRSLSFALLVLWRRGGSLMCPPALRGGKKPLTDCSKRFDFNITVSILNLIYLEGEEFENSI